MGRSTEVPWLRHHTKIAAPRRRRRIKNRIPLREDRRLTGRSSNPSPLRRSSNFFSSKDGRIAPLASPSDSCSTSPLKKASTDIWGSLCGVGNSPGSALVTSDSSEASEVWRSLASASISSPEGSSKVPGFPEIDSSVEDSGSPTRTCPRSIMASSEGASARCDGSGAKRDRKSIPSEPASSAEGSSGCPDSRGIGPS